MRTLKSVIIGVVLLATYTMANAGKQAPPQLSKDDAIKIYVNAVTKGELTGIGDAIDPNVTFMQNDLPVSVTLEAFMGDLKANEGVKQECTTTTSFVETTDDKAIVKVEMKFATSLRTNYVTLIHTRKGWKIREINSIFS
jgi:hypothetical protein